jgi:hypothetical protein
LQLVTSPLYVRPEREHTLRGFFVIGPWCTNPSDLIAKLQKFTHCAITAPDPRHERHRHVVYTGRAARRRRYPTHGPEQFAQELVA